MQVILIARSVHFTASIVSLYTTVPRAVAISAFVVGYLFAVCEAVTTFIGGRAFVMRQHEGL
jgi:hypothetical protein